MSVQTKLACFPALLVFVGCSQMTPTPVPMVGPLNAHIVGVVAASVKSPGVSAGADAYRSRVNGNTIEKQLAAGDAIVSSEYPILKINRSIDTGTATKVFNYNAVFGPNFTGMTAPAEGSVRESASDVPYLRLESGWALLWGECPVSYTQWGNAGTDSTVVILQYHKSGNTVGRVFLLDGDYVDVTTCGSTTKRITWDPLQPRGRYVEVKSDCTISAEQPVPASGAIFDFVSKATGIAHEAEWLGTTSWSP